MTLQNKNGRQSKNVPLWGSSVVHNQKQNLALFVWAKIYQVKRAANRLSLLYS